MSLPSQFTRCKPLTIIGLGNEILSDDGVGIRVVRELKNRLEFGEVTFEELSVGGLQLLDHIIGTEECMIIDAIATGAQPPGTLFRFVQTADAEPVKVTSSHQIDLGQVLGLARLLGATLPGKLTVYGIEVQDITTFHDGCTSSVSAAIPKLVDIICKDIQEGSAASCNRANEWQIIHHATMN